MFPCPPTSFVTMHRERLLATIFVSHLCIASAHAQLNVPEVQGWSGHLMLGAGHTDVESNTVAGNDLLDGGNSRVESIYSASRSNSGGHALSGGEIKYTFAGKNQIFFGGSLEDRLTLDFATQLGWRKQTDIGTFQVGYLFSGIPGEVWQDPYLSGVKRDETERDSSGVRLEWNRVGGSPFTVQLQARTSDIDDEMSGSDPALGCNLECRLRLDRNGEQYVARAEYTFSFSGNHLFRPQLALRREEKDGDAIARDAWSLQLTYSYVQPNWLVVANLVYGESKYDEPNPLYGISQDADSSGIDLAAIYTLPTKSKRWQLTGGAFWAESDSNIEFHDNKISQLFLGVIYNFGHYPLADVLRAHAERER